MQPKHSTEPQQGAVGQYVQACQRAVSSRRPTAVLLSVLVLLLLIGGFLFTQPLPYFVLVIDSGSTGTRIYAYQWRDRFRQVPSLVALPVAAARHKVPRRAAGDKRAYERIETEPGMDHYVKDPSGLQEKALGPLLEWAEAAIPDSRWESTPIFLLATAGLRKLPEDYQEDVLASAQSVLAASPFRFNQSWARIISGREEGIYGWIALNYVTGHLAPHPLSAPKSASLETDADSAKQALSKGQRVRAADEGLRTVGALDLGGSSLEVTFVPDKLTADTVIANLSIMGVEYNLFTYAHHRKGLNDAFDRSVEILLHGPMLKDRDQKNSWTDYMAGFMADAQATNPVDMSALGTEAADKAALGTNADKAALTSKTAGKSVSGSRGADQSIKVASKAAEAVGRGLLRDASEDAPILPHPCLHAGYDQMYRRIVYGAEEPLPSRVRLLGRPNWDMCDELAGLVVNASAPCMRKPCALGASQPVTHQPLYALTGFHVVYHFFGLSPSASLDDLEAKGRRYCDMPWETIHASRGAEIHADRYCFRVPYVSRLLREGLGVPEAQMRIGSGQEGWTLGAALAEGSKVGAGRGPKRKLLSRGALFGVACGMYALWLVFLAGALRRTDGSGFGSGFERKGSGGPPTNGSLPGKLYHVGGVISIPSLPHVMTAGGQSRAHNAQSSANGIPASPTAAIGGGYSSNVQRLSGLTNQRKRVPSMDNLQSLRGQPAR